MSQSTKQALLAEDKRNAKHAIHSALSINETISGRELTERLGISRHYFAKSNRSTSRHARKWMDALDELVEAGYLYIHPTKHYKITKLRDTLVDGDTEAAGTLPFDTPESKTNLEERLSSTIQELLVIAKAVAKEEYESQLKSKDDEIDSLRKELTANDKKLFNFLK